MVVNCNMSNRLLYSSDEKRKTCDAGLGREENQGEATDCERAITIALKHDVFCIADLAQLSLINKNLKGEIRQDHVWKPFLHTNRLGFGSGFGSAEIVIDDSEWPDKNIPPLSNHTLMIPPRIRGPVAGHGAGYFPHPEDTIACSRNIFLVSKQWIGDPSTMGYTDSRFNGETGAIGDLFLSADGHVVETAGLGVRAVQLFYLPRALPVHCSTCCNASFETYPAFVEHLKSSGHIRKMTRERDEIPEEWYDPRLCDDFDTMTNFEQVSALFEFKIKVLRKIREPMSDFAVHRMDNILELLCTFDNIQNILDSTDVRASALKRLIRVVTDVAEESFTHDGVKKYCLDVLKTGWESFTVYSGDNGTVGRMVAAIKD
jgi:hypothetical protein